MTHSEVDPADRQLKKDTSYSPASDRETEALQNEPVDNDQRNDQHEAEARSANRPGTGGPDDPGDIEVDSAELNLDGDTNEARSTQSRQRE